MSGAIGDLVESVQKSYLWTQLGWFDVRQKFRRSVLGPLWITVSMAALIAGMGPLYAAIFDINLRNYLPYLALGIIVWGYISTTATEACNAFIAGTGVIRQTKLPLSSFVLRTVWRNLIALGFNSVLIVAIVFYSGLPSAFNVALALLGVLILAAASVGAGFLVATFCTRYRDMQQVVVSLLQVLMFLTPIFWRADQLPKRSILVDWNPAYYFIEVVRAPLINAVVEPRLYVTAASIAAALWAVGLVLFARYRLRIVYWL